MCKIDQNFNFRCSFVVIVVFVIVVFVIVVVVFVVDGFVIVIVVDLAFLVFDGILI